MKTKTSGMTRRILGSLCLSTAFIIVLGAAGPASAQRNNTSPIYAWSCMNNNFRHTNADGSQYWLQTEGGTTANSFWTQAEMIDMAVDAYVLARTYDSGNLTTYTNEIVNLVNGFRGLHGDNWSLNHWNDDLDVAIIAFARGYQATGTSIMLTDAQSNFATVSGRAQQRNGGLCEQTVVPVNCYENSSVNWTFVIAGNILYNITGNSSYKTEKDGAYMWAKANLYNSTTVQIYDGSVEYVDYSYNYGHAIAAGVFQGSNVMVPNAANYLMNNMNNASYPYDGTYNGYNILPNYGQEANDNDGGFNGITMCWVGYALSHSNYLNSTVLAWAKANVDDAWSHRNGVELMWDHWNAGTPASGLYSWDCSSGAVGMFTIPID